MDLLCHDLEIRGIRATEPCSESREVTRDGWQNIYIYIHTGIDYSTYARGVYMRRDFNPLRIDGLQRADRPRHHARHTDPFRLPENFPRTFQRTVLRPFYLSIETREMRRKSRPKSSENYSRRIEIITRNNESHRR